MRFLSALLLTAASAFAQAHGGMQQLAFLAGTYTAEDQATELGKPDGTCSFAFETGGTTMVRRNHVSYTGGKAATPPHDDLMVFYAEGSELRAIYFDNENHTIHYKVTVPAADIVVLESEAGAGPRYRLTHTVKGKRLDTKFEVAAPGQPYKMYVGGTAVKK